MIAQERLRELLHYNQETGVFTWRTDMKTGRGNGRIHVAAGSVAGSFDGHYLKVGIDGRRYRAHRLAFLYVNGKFPSLHVDHIDGDGTNNAWANLRDVSVSVNLHNQVKRSHPNSTGFHGVAKNHKRFTAQIVVNQKYRYLGTFDTPQQASAAYQSEKKHHTPKVQA